jgi:threonine dehydratase
MESIIPTANDVVEAAQRLRGWLIETPVLESEMLNERVGTRVLVKAECLQHTGSFKIRGALNRMLRLAHSERRNGVVAYSSGNHGQAVALAAKWLGVAATVVMPADAPEIKKRQTGRFGAEIVLYDRCRQDREQIATEIADARGAVLVPPFDHSDVVAGQGTLGLELAAVARSRRLKLGAVYIPCSGGGLTAGCALALRAVYPECSIVAVEPDGFDDMAQSLAAGARRVVGAQRSSICDALQAATPGAIPFAVCKQLLVGASSVGDAEVMRAMALAANYFKLIVEPSGAAALAAVLGRSHDTSEAIALVLSGGNVDTAVWTQALAKYADI